MYCSLFYHLLGCSIIIVTIIDIVTVIVSIKITWISIDLNKNIVDNLRRDWENWWKRQHLYFGWT